MLPRTRSASETKGGHLSDEDEAGGAKKRQEVSQEGDALAQQERRPRQDRMQGAQVAEAERQRRQEFAEAERQRRKDRLQELADAQAEIKKKASLEKLSSMGFLDPDTFRNLDRKFVAGVGTSRTDSCDRF